MRIQPLHELIIGIKGAGEIATAVAWRLYMARIRKIFMMETAQPMAVRRRVSFCEAIYSGSRTVENVTAVQGDDPSAISSAWKNKFIAVGADPEWSLVESMRPDVIIDAILAKKNLGTSLNEAPLVIGLGPGFRANRDTHLVVETRRGHNLGRIIDSGVAEKNTGIPGNIAGFSHERVLRAPADGRFNTSFAITDRVRRNEVIAEVGGKKIIA
ncbi:MAG: selenium-dependent molybdenum cofactor biosynthesis protein YqeB, partial [Thermodesulfobacteriota bacterium]|nr:selenium-dependent molybdenum cofactor biosynthesis protein YqeB [Thermodesulfobacteriota bacterium]